MKAIVFTRYGTPDVLELRDVDKPTPKDDEVLVRVHAVSINDWDWQILQGIPFCEPPDIRSSETRRNRYSAPT